jgi:hypothetical protein
MKEMKRTKERGREAWKERNRAKKAEVVILL